MSSRRDPYKRVKRLAWLGVVFTAIVNGTLLWALAYVNQRFDGEVDGTPPPAIQVFVPRKEVVPPPPKEERQERAPKPDVQPMKAMEPLVAHVAIAPRMPLTSLDVSDIHAIPIGVSDLQVAAPTQTGPMDLPDVDSAPRRARGGMPPYPLWAQRKGLEARMRVEFVVEADGSVSNVRVTRLDGDERFRAIAISAVRTWQFKPGLYRGADVAVRCSQEITFRLED